jgi:transposase
LRRPYAWSKRGERATRYEFSFRGSKYSILPAISLDGILHLEVLDKAINGDDFRSFVEGLLPRMNEWPLPNSVLVVDNASIHKVAGIRQMVEERGARLLYLPAYSPDFNPIELAFSKIKSWMRMNRDRLNRELESENGTVYNSFWEAVHSVTVEHARGWYKHCGYGGRN